MAEDTSTPVSAPAPDTRKLLAARLVGLGAIPYIDRNPSTKPGDRKLIITLFTMLFMFGATLTIAGSFFRGTGFNWAWPWSQGLFFEL